MPHCLQNLTNSSDLSSPPLSVQGHFSFRLDWFSTMAGQSWKILSSDWVCPHFPGRIVHEINELGGATTRLMWHWVLSSDVRLSHVCHTDNPHRTGDPKRRVWGCIRIWINSWCRPCWGVWVVHATTSIQEYRQETSHPLWVWHITGTMNVLSVLEQAGGSLCGVSTLLMRSRHGCHLRQVVQLRSMVLRAQERVRRCVVLV